MFGELPSCLILLVSSRNLLPHARIFWGSTNKAIDLSWWGSDKDGTKVCLCSQDHSYAAPEHSRITGCTLGAGRISSVAYLEAGTGSGQRFSDRIGCQKSRGSPYVFAEVMVAYDSQTE